MHTFKRVYLLASLAAAMIIPALVFTEYVEVSPMTSNLAQEFNAASENTGAVAAPKPLEKDVLDLEPILWSIYCIGFIFFGLKFLKNLFQILKRIRLNPKQKWEHFIHVLLQDQLPPHTFFSYIFLNKQKFDAKEIPKEVLLHEQAHARQKHSYDILFVAILQVVFWFNPFVYLLKKAITLNHEFLADEAVLKKTISKANYQNTLLSYLAADFKNKHQSPLANAVTNSSYSSIKKRFKIMKTKTSKQAILVRSLLMLPLLTLLLYGFSTTKKINKTSTVSAIQISQPFQNNTSTITDLDFVITTNGILSLNEKVISIENIQSSIKKLNPSLTKEQNSKYVNASISTETDDHQELVSRITKELFRSSIYNLSISNINTLKTLNIYKKSFSKYQGKSIEEAELIYLEQEANPTRIDTTSLPTGWNVTMNAVPLKEIIANALIEQKPQETVNEIIIHINSKGQLLVQDDLVLLDDLETYLDKINPHLSIEERQKIVRSAVFLENNPPERIVKKVDDLLMAYGVATVNIVGPEMELKIIAPTATPKQLAEYNKLAKHYNSMSRNKMKIYKKDVERLEYLFSIMSENQKSNAEPFPDLPEPPPAPKAPKALNEREEATNTIQKIIEEQDPYDVVNGGGSLNPSGQKVASPENVKEIESNLEMVKERMKEAEAKMKVQEKEMKKMEAKLEKEAVLLMRKEEKMAEEEKMMEKATIELERQEILIREQEVKIDEEEVMIKKMEDIFAVQESGEKFYVPSPPLPPTPMSPLDHVIAMAKKDAQFLYEGKEISSDEAIKLIKNNKDLNIDSRTTKGQRTLVKISKSPFD